MFTGILQDLRITKRSLARRPGFVVISVLSLALGMGVNIAIASFVNALFVRPIPGVPESGRLRSVYLLTRSGQYTSCSYPDYEYYRDQNRSFSGMLAYLRAPMQLRVDLFTERVYGELVSDDYFSVLSARPALGRLFSAGEADPVAVLSYQFYERRFGGDPAVIGRSVRIGNGLFTVVGVAAPGFRGIVLDWVEPPSVWVPVKQYREAVPPLREYDILGSWGMQSYQVVGRLRPGVGDAQAFADMAGLSARIRVDHPERARTWSADMAAYGEAAPVLLRTTQTRFWPGARNSMFTFIGLLTAVAILILLITYFNVAHLALAHASTRRLEFAIRLSLGAPRRTIIRRLLTENLALAVLGGLAGLAVAAWTSRFLAGFHRAFRLPLDVDAGFDIRVLAFAAAISVLAGIILALIPARLASRGDLSTVLKADAGTAGPQRMRTRQILVMAQVSLSAVLLLGAGLFVNTLRNARAVDVTVRSENVLLSSLDLASRGYDEARGSILYGRILESVRGLPGVLDAALVFVVPLGGQRGGTNAEIPPPGGGAPITAKVGFNVVTPGYFRTVGIPVVRGRDLNNADRRGSAAVAVINEEMARSLFAGSEAIGRRFLLKWRPAATVEVVGIVKDGRFRSYREEPEPTVYVPLAQRYLPAMSLEVRTVGSPASLVGAIRTAVAGLDKDLPLADVKTLKTHFEDALSQERLIASLLSGLGVLALVLAAIGIYGVLSNSVAQRTREIGVRVALGAGRRTVMLLVVANAMRPVGFGLALGVAAALGLTRLVKDLLFGLSPTDPFVIGGTAAALLLVALLAAYVPARRAARVDPITALRHE